MELSAENEPNEKKNEPNRPNNQNSNHFLFGFPN